MTQVTSTAAPITDFDVSSTTGALAYVSDNDIYLADYLGQSPRRLLDGPPASVNGSDQVHFLRFSPSGRQLAFALGGVRVLDITAGGVKFVQQNEPPDSPGAGTYSPVAWAPDGSRLLIHRAFYTTSGTFQINAIAYDNIVYLGTGCCHPSWTPDGRYIYVSGPYYGVRVETGLHRYDTFGDATEETLIGSDLSGDTVPLVDDARVWRTENCTASNAPSPRLNTAR